MIHTYEGEKLSAIRDYPNVCLQVEKLPIPSSEERRHMGEAKELSGEAEANAAQIILKRYAASEGGSLGAFALIRWG